MEQSPPAPERKILYTALFVDDQKALLAQFEPKHTAKIFGHHSTIAFQPKSTDNLEIGAKSMIRIIGRVSDDKGDALLVESPKSANTYPHITLSCAAGIPPFYSNEMIAQAIANKTVEWFDTPIEIPVTEGYYDGTQPVTSKT